MVELPDQLLPPTAAIPLIVPEKALGVAVPPWVLTTCLTMSNCGAMSLLVMVQVALPPSVIVPEHPDIAAA